MKALVVGTGGVGQSIAAIAKRRDPKGEWLEKMVMADYDGKRAADFVATLKDPRFVAEQIDASDVDAVAALAEKHGADILMNLCAPNFNPPLLQAALKAKVHYLDTAMTLSEWHPTDPFHKTGKKLGDDEYALSPEFEKIGKYALAGFGVEPGMADYFARYAADHLFDEIDYIGIRDGSNLEIPGATGISFGFSVWTTIEECNNPAIVFENGDFHTVEPFAELEKFWLPEGIGEVEVGHVEHEEVVQIGHNADKLKGVKKAEFKYALGDEFMAAMDVFRSINIDKAEKIKVGDVMVAPRDVIAAAAPDPNEIGKKYVGKTAAGTYVIGKKDGKERKVYLYQVADNKDCVDKYGTQVVVAQTAFTPVITIELLANGSLGSKPGDPKSGVHNPEAFNADDLRGPHAGRRVPRRPPRDGVRVQARAGPPGPARPGEVRPFRSPWSAAGRLARGGRPLSLPGGFFGKPRHSRRLAAGALVWSRRAAHTRGTSRRPQGASPEGSWRPAIGAAALRPPRGTNEGGPRMTHPVPQSGGRHRRPRLLLLLLVVGLLAAGLASGLGSALAADPSASPAGDKVVLHVGWTNDPDNLNPFIGAETSAYEIWLLNYDFLTGYSLDLKPTPDLATSWETSSDGKTWTFHLREGVKWQDGEPFTADDVAFTYNYIVDNQMGALSSLTTYITEAVAIDDLTVEIRCSKPKANMITTWIPILPEHVWSKVSPKAAGASYQNKPPIVGTGPFQTVEVKKGDYVRMVANPTFWGQKPTIDEILFVTYQNPDTMTQDLIAGTLDAAWGIPSAQFAKLAVRAGHRRRSPTTCSRGTTWR